jgi:glutaredoxin
MAAAPGRRRANVDNPAGSSLASAAASERESRTGKGLNMTTTPIAGKPTVYIITTCPRCKRVKDYLDQLGVIYELVAVDLLPRDERTLIVERFRKFHPVVSFPIIEHGETILIGTNTDEVRQVFGG